MRASNAAYSMKKFDFKSLLPHVVAVIIFIVVASIYCKPVYQGRELRQMDTQGWRGMAQQSFEYKDQHGHFPLWTNSMFSGMPAYQIALDGRTSVTAYYLHYIATLGLPQPVSFFFLACICFYFLCVVAGANPWIGILGGLSYAYSTFDPIIIAVGHNTQMLSIAYAPAVLGGLMLMFRKKIWAGFAVTTVLSALLLMQNHVQIVYYTLMIAFVMFIAFLLKSIREKQPMVAVKAGFLGIIAAAIGLACSATTMLPTYEYSKESMRGGRSELTLGDSTVKTKGGLDKDYAFHYSLGLGETFTFMVPSLYGGSNGGDEFKAPTKFTDQFTALGVPEEQALNYENSFSYWGNQPGTSGPVYLGAVICLLFILGLVYLKGWIKWWLVISSIIGIVLAYGSNFSSINFFLFDHLPFYNKFRAPTMALVIPQLCFPLLGVLAVDKMSKHLNEEEVWKNLKLTGIISGVLLALMVMFYFTSSFEGPNDKTLRENFQQSFLQQVPTGQQAPPQLQQQAQQTSASLITALQSDRKSNMGKDLVRSIILMGLAWGILYLFTKEKIKSKQIAFGGLIVLSGFDLIGVATRYLNDNNYIDESQVNEVFNTTPADQQILNDPDHNCFRVFNQTVDSYNDATTSYHFNSVGGYHPAKLALYNDLILHQLSKGNKQVFDMLNTKYFIVQNPQTGKPQAMLNPEAFGNAWFVKGVKFVPGPNEEMIALDSTHLRDTAVVEEKYKDQIKGNPAYDSTATIKLGDYLNDKITYNYQSNSPQVAVFSEIYYPRGWKATIDGKPADYFRTDYVLRGMYLPAGKHQIEFDFHPESYFLGRMISIIATFAVLLIILGAFFFGKRNKNSSASFALEDLK